MSISLFTGLDCRRRQVAISFTYPLYGHIDYNIALSDTSKLRKDLDNCTDGQIKQMASYIHRLWTNHYVTNSM